MSDVAPRDPDPTLTALCESGDLPLVYTTNMGADVPVFHRQTRDDGPDCGTVFALTMTRPLHVKHAAWIGVPCREEGCFPDAPEPGRRRSPMRDGWIESPDPHLAWQTLVRVVS